MKTYQDRYCKVLKYIDLHLMEELSVSMLSQVAHLSQYHFHRQFSALFNISLSAYIKQLRMKRASYQLAFRQEIKIIDIAFGNGYESPEAFSRAFKDTFGQSPSQFREAPDWIFWHKKNHQLRSIRNFKMQNLSTDTEVNIIDFQAIQIAVLEHCGAVELVGKTIQTFIKWRKENKLPPSISRTFNLVYGDPAISDADDYRFDICASVDSAIRPNDYGVMMKEIPAGRCAVVHHQGSDEKLESIVRYLYSQWLNDSGEELRDFPLFFERLSFFPDVPQHQMRTDIFLPLK